jgi:primosomal protein N' (replication factor Y) (superfamily II helicase)
VPPAVTALLDEAELPAGTDVLGPVELPPGVRRPAGLPAGAEVIRMLVRVDRGRGHELAAALRRAIGVQSARREHEPVRVQMDPLHIG